MGSVLGLSQKLKRPMSKCASWEILIINYFHKIQLFSGKEFQQFKKKKKVNNQYTTLDVQLYFAAGIHHINISQ